MKFLKNDRFVLIGQKDLIGLGMSSIAATHNALQVDTLHTADMALLFIQLCTP